MIARLKPLTLAALALLAVHAPAQAPPIQLNRANPAASTTAAPSNIATPGSTLPPTAPTSLPTLNTTQSPIAATSEMPAKSRSHRADVTYTNGQINVRANDSSLNQILRQISRLTGMTITGGVADERVFGDYGPAEPSIILATLLNGTGSNMLLRESTTAGDPSELVLTPRTGGVTPPSPSTYQDEAEADEPRHTADLPQNRPQPMPQNVPPQNVPPSRADAPPPPIGAPGQSQTSINAAAATAQAQQQPASGPVSMPQPLNNVNGSETNSSPTASTFPTTNSVPTDSLPTPSTTPSSTGIVDAPNPPAPVTTGAAPAASTPESIFQQLQALQQQKAQQQAAPSTTPQ